MAKLLGKTIKRISAAVMLISVMMLFTACSGSDLNEAVFVSSAGISLDRGSYTIAVCGSAADKEGEKGVSFVGSGRTVDEALERIKSSSGYEPFFGHCGAVALNNGALHDGSVFTFLADSSITPACSIYYSDDPSESAGNIPGEGYSAEMYRTAASLENGAAIVLPLAEDPYRTAVITDSGVYKNNEVISAGVMILRGEDISRPFTVEIPGGYSTLELSPCIKRCGEYRDGRFIITADIRLVGEYDTDTQAALSSAVEEVCRSAFHKYASMGIDAFELYKLNGYTSPDIFNADLKVNV